MVVKPNSMWLMLAKVFYGGQTGSKILSLQPLVNNLPWYQWNESETGWEEATWTEMNEDQR